MMSVHVNVTRRNCPYSKLSGMAIRSVSARAKLITPVVTSVIVEAKDPNHTCCHASQAFKFFIELKENTLTHGEIRKISNAA